MVHFAMEYFGLHTHTSSLRYKYLVIIHFLRELKFKTFFKILIIFNFQFSFCVRVEQEGDTFSFFNPLNCPLTEYIKKVQWNNICQDPARNLERNRTNNGNKRR